MKISCELAQGREKVDRVISLGDANSARARCMLTQVSNFVSGMHEGLILLSGPAFLDEFDEKTGVPYGKPLKSIKNSYTSYQNQPIRGGLNSDVLLKCFWKMDL